MGNFKTRLFLPVLLAVVSSCSSIQKMAIGTTSGVFYKAANGIQSENNWDNFKQATLSNLQLAESLLSIKPNDENLLVSLTKGYSGYAFVVNETLQLDDFLAENEKELHAKEAIHNYTKALKFGMRFLNENGVTYKKLVKGNSIEKGVYNLLDSNLSSSSLNVEGVMFTAQSMISMINLQRTNMTLIAQLPMAKKMMDWACIKDPDIHFGYCKIFYGAYEGGRPRMLGGDPEKGKKYFLELIDEQPDNWLARIAYVQYYLIPMVDEDGYREQRFFLETALRKHRNEQTWIPGKEEDEVFKNKLLRLFQATAMKRYEIIKKYEEDLF